MIENIAQQSSHMQGCKHARPHHIRQGRQADKATTLPCTNHDTTASLTNNPEFKASRGWISNFMKRHDFVIRRRTTTGQSLPPHLADKVVSFVKFCDSQRAQHKLLRCDIGNMDETAIWSDMPGNTSVDKRGVKMVPLLTTGHEKSRVTVFLSAIADGCKLPPLVVS